MSKEQFIKNYKGSLDPESVYNYLQEKEANKQTYGDATHNKAHNKQLQREADARA